MRGGVSSKGRLFSRLSLLRAIASQGCSFSKLPLLKPLACQGCLFQGYLVRLPLVSGASSHSCRLRTASLYKADRNRLSGTKESTIEPLAFCKARPLRQLLSHMRRGISPEVEDSPPRPLGSSRLANLRRAPALIQSGGNNNEGVSLRSRGESRCCFHRFGFGFREVLAKTSLSPFLFALASFFKLCCSAAASRCRREPSRPQRSAPHSPRVSSRAP